jgi:Na+/glutamate symporter
MNKAISIFLGCFFVAVGIKLIHDFGVVYQLFDKNEIDYLYGVSNTLFKLAPAIAVFILTRKLKDIRRVLIHLAFVLYLSDLFDELFFNPYEYGIGEWLTAIIFYFIINRYYKNK